jgi:hypothetical protein
MFNVGLKKIALPCCLFLKKMSKVCRCVEAPIQLVTLLYLMLRGILTLPWSEPLSASCVEDSLGRQDARPDHTH